MIQLQEHTLLEKVREGAATSIYTGYRTADRTPVMLKVLQREYPSAREVARIEHEYRLLGDIDLPGVIKTLGLERLNHGPVLVLEHTGGASLADLIGAPTRMRGLDLRTALGIARSLANTLAALHGKGILHKDIKPANILCDLDAGWVKLIDFGIASRLGQETQRLVRPDALEGTLAYISPEQTGRMNRDIDHRTDLYALGVTLYEMVTGVLPFQTKDPIELVHCHIARTPVSPRERSPEIPEVVSALVMKLLAKAAEDRYQHAAGLAADLEVCLDRLDARGAIAPFPLGRRDRSEKLSIPQKLYGREAEVDALLRAFERAATGRPELVTVAGSAGVGKSALVHEIHKAIARRGGEFIAGKFDQFHRELPFAAFTLAFGDLVRQLLTEPSAALMAWRERLSAALGDSGRVLTDMIPELELIIGPQPDAAPMGPKEAQNRFERVLQDFVRVFCTPSHPLVVFLDDLQWADPASLSLMRVLLADPSGGHLLMIGAYRDGEVDEAHPLRLALEDLRNKGVAQTSIVVPPLQQGSVRALLEEALPEAVSGRGEARIDALAEDLHAKTHGNPFFLTQLLATLSREGLIRLDLESGRWTWDAAKIATAPLADNVVELMARKIQSLDPDTQRLVSLAACIGHQFDLAELAAIAERTHAAAAQALWPALIEGLVVPLDGDYRLLPVPGDAAGAEGAARELDIDVAYRFLHDRVQQAAYALIDADRKQDVHLRIGRLLRTKLTALPTADALFEVVRHLNAGGSQITARDERRDLARRDLAAGRAARRSTAYAAAAGFLEAGIEALGAAGWDDDRDLAFALHREHAGCVALTGRFNDASAALDKLLSRAGSPQERAEVHSLRVGLYMLQGRFTDGMTAGRAGLSELGVELPDTPEQCMEACGREIAGIDQALSGRTIESLLDAPTLTGDRTLVLQLLAELLPISFWIDPRVFSLIVVKQVSLSLAHGHAAQSAHSYAFYGMVLAGAMGRVAEAIRFGHLALKLLDKLHATEVVSATNLSFGLYAAYGEPLRTALACFKRAQKAGIETGDFFHASHGSFHIPIAMFRLGEPLERVSEEIVRSTAVLARTKDAVSQGFLAVIRQLVACLRGQTRGRASLSDERVDEAAFVEQLRSTGNASAVFLVHLVKLQIAILYDDPGAARATAAGAEQALASVLGVHWTTDYDFYASLAICARYPSAPAEEQAELLAALAAHQAKIAVLAESCPENERHRRELVRAEAARITGDVVGAMDAYDAAITLAREHGYPQHEALANELCARFHLASGRTRIARPYLLEARYGYSRWGATEKVKDLDERYAGLLVEAELGRAAFSEGDALAGRPVLSALVSSTSITAGSTHLFAGSALDLVAVLQATQAIGSEIVLDRLLDRLMRIVLAAAGAQKACLLLDRCGALSLEATATVDPDQVRTGLNTPLEAPDKLVDTLPLTVAQYVERTRESIVLGAPGDDPRFSSDPYIIANRPKSILGLALLHQGRMAGVLYLESSAVHDAFRKARVQLLEVLSGTAAIAVQNAMLYTDVQVVSADLKHSNEMLRAANERLAAELAERERLQHAQAMMQEEIIRQQQARLSELSTPLIPITDRIMVMPLVGTIDEPRSAQMIETALHGVQANQALVVILDVTGVKNAESSVAGTLMSIAGALRLLGTQVVITGIRPEVAEALILLDVDLGSVKIRQNLKAGIAYALGRTGEVGTLPAVPRRRRSFGEQRR